MILISNVNVIVQLMETDAEIPNKTQHLTPLQEFRVAFLFINYADNTSLAQRNYKHLSIF